MRVLRAAAAVCELIRFVISITSRCAESRNDLARCASAAASSIAAASPVAPPPPPPALPSTPLEADGGGGGLREQGRNGMRDGPPRCVGGGLRLPLSLSRPPCPRPAQARTPPPNTHAQAGGQASARRRRRGARFPMPIASAAFFEGRPWRHAKPAHVWPAPTQRHTRPRPVCCGTRGGARAAGSDGERGRHSSPTRRWPPSRLLSPARPRARRDAGAAAERAGVRRRETWGGARRVEF
jgi:hypothetical protein